MNDDELNQAIQEIKGQSSNVQIRLIDNKTGKVFYKELTNTEFMGIVSALKGIEWHSLKGDKK